MYRFFCGIFQDVFLSVSGLTSPLAAHCFGRNLPLEVFFCILIFILRRMTQFSQKYPINVLFLCAVWSSFGDPSARLKKRSRRLRKIFLNKNRFPHRSRCGAAFRFPVNSGSQDVGAEMFIRKDLPGRLSAFSCCLSGFLFQTSAGSSGSGNRFDHKAVE